MENELAIKLTGKLYQESERDGGCAASSSSWLEAWFGTAEAASIPRSSAFYAAQQDISWKISL